MGRMKDPVELEWAKMQYKEEKTRHINESIKQFGENLGTALHKYIYGEVTQIDFCTTIAKLVDSGNVEEKALALSALIEANKELTNIKLKKALKSINPSY